MYRYLAAKSYVNFVLDKSFLGKKLCLNREIDIYFLRKTMMQIKTNEYHLKLRNLIYIDKVQQKTCGK